MTRTTEYRERAMFPERVARWVDDRVLTQDLMAEYLEREHPVRQEVDFVVILAAVRTAPVSPAH
jgi:hypothetical protein